VQASPIQSKCPQRCNRFWHSCADSSKKKPVTPSLDTL